MKVSRTLSIKTVGKPKESQKIKLSILIPVRNEGINIGIMLKILKALVDVPHEVLIIHDDPDDDTIPVVKKLGSDYSNAKLVHNDLGKGIVNALKVGISKSEGEYILLFAADEVGPAIAIDEMIQLMDEGCDLVSATRYAHGGRRLGGHLTGKALSKLANKLIFILSGSKLTDATTGIKMFRRDILDKITLESKPIGWAVVFEIAVKAQAAGMKLGEVPIISIDRLYGGKSTFRLSPWIKEYLKWFKWGLRHGTRMKNKERTLVRIPKTTAK